MLTEQVRIDEDSWDISKMVLAAKEREFDIALKTISKKPYTLNVIPAERTWSVLHQAVLNDAVEVIEELLEYPNCDANQRTKKHRGDTMFRGITPIRVAEGQELQCLRLVESKSYLQVYETPAHQLENCGIPRKGRMFLEIGLALLSTDLVDQRDSVHNGNLQHLCNNMYKLIEERWQFVKDVVSKYAHPICIVFCEDIGGATSSDDLKAKLIRCFAKQWICREVHAAMKRTLSVDCPCGSDIFFAPYTLFLQATLLFWQDLEPVTQTTYTATSAELSGSHCKGYRF